MLGSKETQNILNTSRVAVCRVNDSLAIRAFDRVATEEPLEIQIGQERKGWRTLRPVSVTMRTPGHDAELAIGFLFGEGILGPRSDVAAIEFPQDPDRQSSNLVRVQLRDGISVSSQQLDRNFYMTSSCGLCGKSSLEAVRRMTPAAVTEASTDFQISAPAIHQMSLHLRESQEIFEQTGGLHAAGLFEASGKLQILREDVGRHNAVDKIVGAMWLEENIPLRRRVLFVSGRASFELVQKAARAGIPVLAAVGAPSSLAVELAKACGMTLLGFVRDGRFNVYSADFRLRQAEGSHARPKETILS
jgi:FdhD protein